MNNSKRLIVDPSGETAFTTITAAIEAASDGGKILIRQGDYCESLQINKKLELVGEGSASEIRILGDSTHQPISCAADVVIIRNISLIGSQAMSAIRCDSGVLDLEHCLIEGGEYGVFFYNGNKLSVDSCHIHKCRSGGIYAMRGRGITITESLIEQCGGNGIEALDCESVYVRHCRIANISGYGIQAKGGETFEVESTECESALNGSILDNHKLISEEVERISYERRAQS
jgi:nitrous oxidase accessory protein NosD